MKYDSEREKALQEFSVSEVKVLKNNHRHEEKTENFDEELLKSLE